MDTFVSTNVNQEATLEFAGPPHSFGQDTQNFIWAAQKARKRQEIMFIQGQLFFFFPKLMPKVMVLMNFMDPKHYLACSQDPSGHWKPGSPICKHNFQMWAMRRRLSLQSKYLMFCQKHAANLYVQNLYPAITTTVFCNRI